jgi:hypothetical protein
MACRVEHLNRETGITYVYEAVSAWDAVKKQSRNKQVCVGKIDPKTGAFIPSKRLVSQQVAVRDPAVTATASVIGPSIILEHVTAKLSWKKW